MKIARPPATPGAGHGLLRHEHFQVAYTTNDIDRACALFSERYGIREYRRLEGQVPAGGSIRIELAWVGGVMYELIRAEGPGTDFFNAPLAGTTGFAIRHHHFGYLTASQADWDAVMQEIARGGWTVCSNSHHPGFLRACIVHVPELDHYLEYFLLEAGGVAFFEGVPRS